VDTTIGSQTTCWDLPHVEWTDGTNKSLATFDGTSETYQSLTISGGPAECDWNATSGTCYVTGLSAGTRTFTLPAGFTVTSGALGRSGASYTLYHPGGAIPTTSSFTFSTTPLARRSVPFSFTPPSGVSTVRIKVGSAYAVSLACPSTCAPPVELPAGLQTVLWEYLDGSGNVLFSSNPATI
jgi:hypothetical protein